MERSNWWQKLPSSCLVHCSSHFKCFWSLRSWQILDLSFWLKLTSSPYVNWSYGVVLVVRVSLILFRIFSPKRFDKPARNFSFQKG